MRNPTIVVGVLVAALASAAPAQSERQRQAGRVTDKDGKPCPRATVTFLTREVPWTDAIGAADLVRVQCDTRGRFRAQLLRARAYSVWAFTADGGHGSRVREGVQPGRPLRLVADLQARRVRLTVSGAERWESQGELGYRIATRTHHVQLLPLEVTDDGSATLPLLPGEEAVLEVRLNGRLLAHRRVSLQGERFTARLPWPYPLLVRARAGERALAGATVSIEIDGRWTPSGRTDEEGVASLPFPLRVDRRTPARKTRARILVSEPGHGERVFHGDIATTPDDIERAATRARRPDLDVRLAAVVPIRGRLLVAQGKPVAEQALLYEAPLSIGKNGWTHPKYPRVVHTDEAGRFAIPAPGVPARASVPIQFWIFTTAPAALDDATRVAVPLLLHSGTRTDVARDLGDLVLDSFVRLDVRVQNDDGAPAPGALVAIAPRGSDGLTKRRVVEHRCSRRGEVALLLPPGEYTLGTTAGGAIAGRVVELPGSERPLVLALGARIEIRGKVVDSAGRPLAGARVTWSDDWRQRDRVWQLLKDSLRSDPVTTGADGAFRLRVPCGHKTYYLRASVVIDGKPRRSLADTVVRVGRAPATDADIVIADPPAPGK